MNQIFKAIDNFYTKKYFDSLLAYGSRWRSPFRFIKLQKQTLSSFSSTTKVIDIFVLWIFIYIFFMANICPTHAACFQKKLRDNGTLLYFEMVLGFYSSSDAF